MENSSEKYKKSLERRKYTIEYFREVLGKRLSKKDVDYYVDLITPEDYEYYLKNYIGDLEKLKGKLFIDIGAGFGSNVHDFLQKLGVRFINVDISLETLEYLENQGKGTGVLADALNLPFKDSSIDGCICLNFMNVALENIEDLEIFLGEVKRVLKPEGIFIQSNFGYSKIDKRKILEYLKIFGFRDIKILEPLDEINRELIEEHNYDYFAFIAKK